MAIHTSFICDNEDLNLLIRNNLNGDFSKAENILEINPGAFINISWKDEELMLPYSPRKGFISFSDKKWDFRYKLDDKQYLNEDEPSLYELLPNSKFIEHKCNLKDN
tara:strand:+ start:945 stop:1265 length:321 start_codon:yes stop_codon:yes gene_type:complete